MLDCEQKAKVLLLMWRGWFIRNDAIFGKGEETIIGSTKFFMSYSETLSGISKQGKRGTNDNGKSPIDSLQDDELRRGVWTEDRRRQERWTPPMTGWVKLNIHRLL
jgi:hypothetical protein